MTTHADCGREGQSADKPEIKDSSLSGAPASSPSEPAPQEKSASAGAQDTELSPGGGVSLDTTKPAASASPPAAESPVVKERAEEEEVEAGTGQQEKKDLQEEEEAEDVETHAAIPVETKAEDIERERAEAAEKARRKRIANIVGISINALLFLIIIWLLKTKLGSSPENAPEPVTEVATAPTPEATGTTSAPALPPVSVQRDEPLNPQGTLANPIEEALRGKQLQCRIEKFDLSEGTGLLTIVLRKEVYWDVNELKKAAHRDALLALRTAFESPHVKAIGLRVEAPLAQKGGSGSFETVLELQVNRDKFDACGAGNAEVDTLPESLQPRFHKVLTDGK